MPKARHDPDAPCACNSGVRYADCHQPILEAPKGKMVAMGQKLYAKAWSSNADHYQSQGLYTVLAKELTAAGDVRRVLDIGCGHGNGLEALRAEIQTNDWLLIGIDENPDCLAGAAGRLNLSADDPALHRMTAKVQLSGLYEINVKGGPLTLSGDTILANVDLMVPDAAFEAWLDNVGSLDAITLWFSGIHKARSKTKVAQQYKIKNDVDHREVLEAKIFQLARRRLRPGGLVQIVNRFAGSNLEVLRRRYETTMAQTLANLPFDVISVTSWPYSEPGSANAIQVKSQSFDSAGLQTAAFSVLARGRIVTTSSDAGPCRSGRARAQ